MAIVAYGLLRFRQNLILGNTAKEVMLYLRKARRYSISNVVTTEGNSSSGYYIYIDGDGVYQWGECDESSGCIPGSNYRWSVKSPEYTGVEVSPCHTGSANYSVVKFDNVTGEFRFFTDPTELQNNPLGGDKGITCTIDIELSGVITTTRQLEVSGSSRTVKLLQ